MEIVLLYGGLTSNRRFVCESRWVLTLFSQSLFFLIALLFMKVGEGRFLCGFYKALVTSMQECLYHHHDECCCCVGANFTILFIVGKWLCKPTILIMVLSKFKTSLQAELIIYIYIYIYNHLHPTPPQQSMELPDFEWLFFLVHYSLHLFWGFTILITYTCACADIACLSILHNKFLFLDYLPHLSGSTLVAIRKYCISCHTSHKCSYFGLFTTPPFWLHS
jgi:hypothetical protein